ncbi:2-oxoacid:acceptor oxidoreductase family protein [Sodalis ligni]|uniref:Pyruvate-ferredoxin/flavodoxin oxidoreductase n=1 Tax=Sodalis ligni TaxID=2697027 RepID=A0A4R1N856_9GAMM|nr:2-oxoacid:acceptor oxidoreductase family protein [Sodalis ligni]TCL03383.1 pyruvate-ferredoxin/flavodoxin oxidoreductase [Sodalis ligni]
MKNNKVKYPGIPSVIHGNGAVAYIMNHVCGGVIGYPITPSTEIAEIFEAARAEGGVNVWGKHPFFFSPEGEHSAQSGALGAALTGGQFISNASSSQGILYAMESHYVTVGKKVGGFVLQVAARVVSKHSLNVMAGHDDVYALLPSGYTILFGANPQEAADLAAIAYRVSSLSLIPVANAMDGFSTSHMLCEALLPEPALLAEYLGDPAGRIKAPTAAQEMLYGAKGRVFQLKAYLSRHQADIAADERTMLQSYLELHGESIEQDLQGLLMAPTLDWLPAELHAPWRRQWLNAFERGTRQRVPALIDVNNPGLTGGVQNQPDFQAGSADHRTHFASDVPALVRQAMAEYGELTGRRYQPVQTFMCEDAEDVMVALGSVTDDIEAVVAYLRRQGQKVGLVAVKLLQPFPEAEVVAALRGKRAVTVLERSDQTELTVRVTRALFQARENADGVRHAGIPALQSMPTLTTAIFGLGGHDLQPRHLIAAFKNMSDGQGAPLIYLGSQFFSPTPSPYLDKLQARLKGAYPETERMALNTGPNPNLLPEGAFRIRFHSVGGYGTIATGKLLTDILAGALDMHSKSAPKYGSEKSGAPTNYYITLSPEPVKITNAELEDVEIVISPDHKVFSHTNPLRGLTSGGTFIMQSNLAPEEVWRELPASARKTLRDKAIRFLIIDAFAVAKKHAPTPELETRMMGIAFIGAVVGHVERVSAGSSADAILAKIRQQIGKKFGAKGGAVVEGNMAVIHDGIAATQSVDYASAEFADADGQRLSANPYGLSLSADGEHSAQTSVLNGLFDHDYYEETVARPFREGTIGEAPVLPGAGLFMPAGTASAKDKGLFRRSVPEFHAEACTGCMECALVCPDAAIPNSVHDIHELLLEGIRRLGLAESRREAMAAHLYPLADAVRETYRQSKTPRPFHEVVADAAAGLVIDAAALRTDFAKLADVLAAYPVARTRPFFDAAEKNGTGGGLYAAVIDPWKCTGCLECISVCGPGALSERSQDAPLQQTLQARFEFMTTLPKTPARFYADALKPDGDIKRLLLDPGNYYATTGGHGGCRGCGEVTAIRLVVSANHAVTHKRQQDHRRELEDLISRLNEKRSALPAAEEIRRERLDGLIGTLEKRLYLYEGGPGGNGPAGAVIANSTGCSSVYASTFPYNCYNDPWVNSLFQDAQPLAKGMFEGLAAQSVNDIRALRLARLELADQYLPEQHDAALRYLDWTGFTADELALLPTVMTIGGDGATYDIGFGALSRILTSGTPLKVVVLNTGVYSNTGGQASTSSFIGQDADLARIGKAQGGKHEARKELGLIASFHPDVFVCSSTTALPGHFLKNTLEFLRYSGGPAVMDIYTPCQSEHGITDAAAARHGRLAVESRMNPVFVHDTRRGASLHEWFSLEGNPDTDKDWAGITLEYLDENGGLQLLNMALTPAVFALGENRFRKQFHAIDNTDGRSTVAVEDYIDLPPDERAQSIAFVYSVDANRHLIKLGVSPSLIELVEERRKYWRMLQYLAGQHAGKMAAEHDAAISALQSQYEASLRQRDTAMDVIARAMSRLATSSKAPAAGAGTIPISMVDDASSPGVSPAAAAGGEAPVTLSPEDQEKCTNCKTCYQDLPEIFERTLVVINGESREVAHMIPGVLERITITPELKRRIERVAANCDAEIIQ